jgi:hypothetical protein
MVAHLCTLEKKAKHLRVIPQGTTDYSPRTLLLLDIVRPTLTAAHSAQPGSHRHPSDRSW